MGYVRRLQEESVGGEQRLIVMSDIDASRLTLVTPKSEQRHIVIWCVAHIMCRTPYLCVCPLLYILWVVYQVVQRHNQAIFFWPPLFQGPNYKSTIGRQRSTHNSANLGKERLGLDEYRKRQLATIESIPSFWCQSDQSCSTT